MRAAMRACLGCGRTFEGEWLGHASVMGRECPECGEVAAASEGQAYESGTLRTEPGSDLVLEDGGEGPGGRAGGR